MDNNNNQNPINTPGGVGIQQPATPNQPVTPGGEVNVPQPPPVAPNVNVPPQTPSQTPPMQGPTSSVPPVSEVQPAPSVSETMPSSNPVGQPETEEGGNQGNQGGTNLPPMA